MMIKILDRAKHAAMINSTKHGKDIGRKAEKMDLLMILSQRRQFASTVVQKSNG